MGESGSSAGWVRECDRAEVWIGRMAADLASGELVYALRDDANARDALETARLIAGPEASVARITDLDQRREALSQAIQAAVGAVMSALRAREDRP